MPMLPPVPARAFDLDRTHTQTRLFYLSELALTLSYLSDLSSYRALSLH